MAPPKIDHSGPAEHPDETIPGTDENHPETKGRNGCHTKQGRPNMQCLATLLRTSHAPDFLAPPDSVQQDGGH